MRSDEIVGAIIKDYGKYSKHLYKVGFYLDSDISLNPSLNTLKKNVKSINEKFEIKNILRNTNSPFSKRYENEIKSHLSKFQSRYEIAFYTNGLKLITKKNNPFKKNEKKRLAAYSSMVKFLLVYSAYENFLGLFNYSDKLDKNVYQLMDKDKLNSLLNSLNKRTNKMEILLEYLMENMEDKNHAFRVSIFLGKKDLEKKDKKGQNLYEPKYKKIYTELENAFGKLNTYKNLDVLLIPKLLRHKIAHGDLAASYSPRNKKSKLDYSNMISLYESLNDLLFSIMDKKFNQVYNNLNNLS